MLSIGLEVNIYKYNGDHVGVGVITKLCKKTYRVEYSDGRRKVRKYFRLPDARGIMTGVLNNYFIEVELAG